MRTMDTDLTIINAVIFDGTGADRFDGSLRIVDGRIVELGDGVKLGDQVLDARGRTVIPGLIDAHFHAYAVSLHTDTIEVSPLSYLAIAATGRLSAALRRGFTTVLDVAGGDAGLARAIEQGLFASPRYYYTGAALSQTGGHGDPRSGYLEERFLGGRMCVLVDGEDEVRRVVRERFRRGAHAIKIMTSGGVVSLTDPIRVPQYSAGEIRAAVDEATRRGSYVAAHAYSPEAIKHSVENGVRSIEHGNLLDQETAQLMAEHDAYLVPTLGAYDAIDRRGALLNLAAVSQAKNKEVLLAGQGSIGIARTAGVSIGFGSDLMGELEDDQLCGLRLQIEADGVANTICSATSVNAALIGRQDLGRIAVGAIGDVLILDGDPFEDPTVLWDEARPKRVVQGGTVAL